MIKPMPPSVCDESNWPRTAVGFAVLFGHLSGGGLVSVNDVGPMQAIYRGWSCTNALPQEHTD